MQKIKTELKSTILIGNTNNEEKADFICNGINDQEMINKAIESLPSIGGKIVLLTGTYSISKPIVPKLNNLEIEGMGMGRTIIRSIGDLKAGLFHDLSPTKENPRIGLTIRSMTLDGSSQVKSNAFYNKGIFITHLKRALFENLHVYNTGATGIGVDFLVDSIIKNNIIEKCGYPDAITGNSGIGIGTGDDSEEPLIISSNHISKSGLAGILLESQESADGVFLHHIITNNIIREGMQSGVIIRGLRRAIVVSNIIVGNEYDGIRLENYKGNSVGEILMNNNIIQGNKGYGIYIASEDATSIQLQNNNLEENVKGTIYSRMPDSQLHYFENIGDSNNKIMGDLHVRGPSVILSDLPTADPKEKGQLWNDRGTLKISSGD